MDIPVGSVVDLSFGSSKHLAIAQMVARRPIKKTPRSAHLLYTDTFTFER